MTELNRLDEARKLVKLVRIVARDAEERTKAFTEYVAQLTAALENPKDVEMIERGWMQDANTLFEIGERVEAVTHVHSGGSDAMHIRHLNRELFNAASGQSVTA